MKYKKLPYVYFFTIITVLLNVLMIFVIRHGDEETFSNIFAIIVTLFAFGINWIAEKTNQSRKVRPEFYGILFMFGISAIRFANRFTQIPDSVNYSSLIFFIGAGIFLLFVAIGRIASNKNNHN